ncbi:hypothetical protein CCY01nite_27890 [Chitinophaga cymbidii]|uniref:Thioredoxin domain-containing protein n=2 Tax=Chitinophaga cymbidii TaxID=1096750 RepID=A0A512RLH6_9BACT|nr:hypothetical protein CCY01nite_27890 [Chitinophaga cymbidii]
MNLATAGFYVLTSEEDRLFMLEIYLRPGDQLVLEMNKEQVAFTGKGSVLNQFLHDISGKSYTEQVAAIEGMANPELVRHKALLKGNAQGAYLNKVFGPLVEAKIHGADPGIQEAAFTGLNIRLVPEIMVYPNWLQTITELMYAKMKAGELKVRRAETWVADFGSAIENQQLKEAFMTAALSYSVSNGDLVSIQAEIREALPFIKDKSNLAKINALKPKIVRWKAFFRNALPGTDMSQYTFQNVKGETVSIKDYRGKLIYVDIWNTGCKPCIAEMPYLKELEHELKGRDIVFLSVSCDNSTELWKKFMQKRNMNGEQLIMIGKKDTFFDRIGMGGVPRFVILDKAGKIIDYNSCKRPSNPILKIYLEELLTKSAS